MAVLTISMSMTVRKTEELEQVFCIKYPVIFKDKTEASLDSESEVNIMTQTFAHQIELKVRRTNVKIQRLNGTTPET